MSSRVIDCCIKNTGRHESASAAMKVLTGAGFRLYSYLCNMAELEGGRSVFQLCPDDICQYTGLCERAYYQGFNNLIEHGYIRQKAGKRRYYLFNGECGK